MFKNIGLLLDRKKAIFSKSQNTSSQIKDLIKKFLEDKFGDSLKGYSLTIKYSSQENSLTITADSKIVASELSLQLADLSSVLKKEGIILSRILIR